MQPLLIGGEWVETAEALPNFNPSDTRDVIDEVAQAGRREATDAIAAARQAAPGWAAAGAMARHEVLRRAAVEMAARREELGRLLSREEGKPLKDGIAEAARAAHIFDVFAGEALRLHGELGDSVRPGVEVAVTRAPMGVVGLITRWTSRWRSRPGSSLRRSPTATPPS